MAATHGVVNRLNVNPGMVRRVTVAILGVALLLGTLPVTAQEASGFQWSVSPYIWASRTKVDLNFRDESLGGGTVSFSDLLDQLDSAFMVHLEGGNGHWSLFADITYLETSDAEQRPVFLVKSTAETTVLDTAVAYWPGGVGSSLSVIAGMRYSGFDNRYRFLLDDREVAHVRDEDDYYDALLGLRYRFELGGRWDLLTRADVSFGQSEGTWLVQAVFGRTIGKREANRILLGYQYKVAEFKSGDLTSDFSYHGPIAGFNFRF